MKIPFADLKSQYEKLKPQIQSRINKVLDHGQYIMGPEVSELELKLATYTDSKYCVTVSSGTEALLISLMTLGVGNGDEVITTPFTFVSTAEVIVMLGAKPVFVDIEPDTLNINADLIKSKITKNTKAIIPVSLYGQTADMDKINSIAKEYGNIPVIEDAAQSFGATYKGKKSCNLSTIGCTSFFPSKPLGCYGDGGAIFTNDNDIVEILRQIRVHGQSERYIYKRIGVGGRMDTIQCAVVLAKFESFDEEIKKRQEAAKIYDILLQEFLSSSNKVQTIKVRENRTSAFAQYSILIQDRDEIQKKLKLLNIPTSVYYPVPLNQQDPYKKFCCSECTPVSNDASKRIISLPMSSFLEEHHQQYIINNFIKIIK
jgi:UDP-2-acetamido-2-deoxy-ribo-hexuluronate aminotransferase